MNDNETRQDLLNSLKTKRAISLIQELLDIYPIHHIKSLLRGYAMGRRGDGHQEDFNLVGLHLGEVEYEAVEKVNRAELKRIEEKYGRKSRKE